MASVNDLNTAWISAGQKVTDLQDKSQKMAVALASDPSSYTEDDVKKVTDDLKAAKTARDFAKSALDDAKAEAEAEKPTDITEKKVNIIQKTSNAQDFVHNFVDLATGKKRITDLVTSGNTDGDTSNAGLTIPPDIQTNINQLKRQYASLEQYVKVENVSTPTGSRVYEPFETITPLANLDDENALIGDNDDPKLEQIKYTIHRYAGISTMPNTLLSDSDQNIQAWIEQFVSRKDVVTRNGVIISAMNNAPKKPTIAKFDDILDMIYTAVDPAIQSTSVLMTNVSGFAQLAKVKDAMGQYLIQANVVPDMPYSIRGHQVIVISDRWLPSAGTAAAPVYPLYYGDLSQAATLFDRQQMSLVVTNIGAGAFERDQTKLRVIDRFDVQATDADAFVAGSFSAIADQQANFPAASAGK